MASNSFLALHPRDLGATSSPAKPVSAIPQKSVWRRIGERFLAARQRQAERAVARYLAQNGMKFTDSVERDIERHLLTGHVPNLR